MILWNPLEPAHIANPYPMYARLRQEDPVHHAQTGEWIITRYNDVKELLRSPHCAAGNRLAWLKKALPYFNEKGENLTLIYEAMQSFMVLLSNQKHQQIRSLVSRAWTDRTVDDIVQKNVHELIARFPRQEPFDFVYHFAQPLPVLTISAILGLPLSQYREVKRLGMKLTETLGLYVTLKELVSINSAAKALIDFFSEQLHQKRKHPDDSLISRILIANAQDAAPLTDQELTSLYIFLFIAGEETSANLLGAGTYNLLQGGNGWQQLASNATLAETCVEELLRFDPSVQIAGRNTLKDLMTGGKNIPAGATLSLVIGSANRDETVFDAPDELRLERTPNRHLTFGLGTHHCMGDWLARRQAVIAFKELTQRFPSLQLTNELPEWNRILTFRSLNRLMVQLP